MIGRHAGGPRAPLTLSTPLMGGENHPTPCDALPLGMKGGLTQTAQTLPESRAQIARPGPRWPASRSDQPLLPLGPP